MLEADARQRFSDARVASLATVGEDGRPHLVPIVFALDGDRICFAVDFKPKRKPNLKRLDNIRANPHVSLLVDRYDEDWSQLWWVRVDGVARIVDDDTVIDALVAKYEQYQHRRPQGPAVLIDALTWRWWSPTSRSHRPN